MGAKKPEVGTYNRSQQMITAHDCPVIKPEKKFQSILIYGSAL